jgi:hypothetical protein
VVAAPIRDLPARLAELPPGPVLVMIGRVFAEVAAVMPRESGASSTPQGLDETSTSITNVR